MFFGLPNAMELGNPDENGSTSFDCVATQLHCWWPIEMPSPREECLAKALEKALPLHSVRVMSRDLETPFLRQSVAVSVQRTNP